LIEELQPIVEWPINVGAHHAGRMPVVNYRDAVMNVGDAPGIGVAIETMEDAVFALVMFLGDADHVSSPIG
jgi:hypothetical protein